MTPIPLITYAEGPLVVGQTLYSYTSSVALNLISYRTLMRSGTSVDIEVRKNGTLLDVLEITALDSGVVEIPNLFFSDTDVLTLVVSAAVGTPTGVSISFQCTVEDAVDQSAVQLARRIQTPLVARFEGNLVDETVFFKFIPDQQIGVSGYTISLRTAADANVVIDLLQAGTQVAQMTLTAGSLVTSGVLAAYFNTSEELTLKLTSVGGALPGKSLLVLLNYSNIQQTTFSSFQTPFIVEYEGIAATSSVLLYYTVPRAMTLAVGQLFSRSAATVQVGLYRNGILLSTFSLTAATTGTPVELAFAYAAGDLLEARVLTSVSYGLLLTLDYYIETGNQAASFTYYSDPQSDLIMLARQVGIGGAKADAIPVENLEKYQQDVDQLLNGRLRALYRTPLAKVARGYNPWPGAVQTIAQRLVLQRLLNDIYSDVEPNASQNVAANAQLAQDDLQQILDRQVLLEGQKLRAKNYGSNPYSEALGVNQQPTAPPQ